MRKNKKYITRDVELQCQLNLNLLIGEDSNCR